MQTIFTQVIIMFLLAGVGAVLFRTKKLSVEGNKSIGNILIYLSLPAVIIQSFLVERTPQRTLGLAISAVGALLSLLLSIAISRIFFKKDSVAQFAASFSNPGFFGIPIITAYLGNDCVFYIAAYIALLNLFQWSYGVSILTGNQDRFPWNKLLKAPFLIAIILGLLLYFTQLQLPHILTNSISLLAGLNTPLAMFVVGVYLAQINWRSCVRKIALLRISVVKLLIVPAVTLILLLCLPHAFADLKFVLLIAAACPSGSNIVVYAQLHNCDAQYASDTVVVTTLLSILTIPLFSHFLF